jgi:hypothetical protein
MHLAAEPFEISSNGFERLATARAGRNGRAGFGEIQRYRSADPATAAAYDNPASFEIDVHGPLDLVAPYRRIIRASPSASTWAPFSGTNAS